MEDILSQYSVKIIKFVSGDEIVCYLTDDSSDPNSITVKMPYGLIPSQSGVTLLPFSIATLNPKADQSFTLFKHGIIMIADAPTSIKDAFTAKTTGLSVSSGNPGLILG